MWDYAGAIHFHSSYSYDAGIPLPEIIQAAGHAGLDFAILTDHFNLTALHEGWERYHALPNGKAVLLLVGEEISPRYNHYLAFNLRKDIVVSKLSLHPQAMIDAVTAQGGFGFIAHPDHSGAPLVHTRAYPWLAWDVKGYAGISIWDLMGDWCRQLTSPWGVLKAVLWPARVLQGPSEGTLKRWDALCQESHCVALGEIDNHANRRSYWGLSKQIFPFPFAFRTIRTHVLLDHALQQQLIPDRQVILEALRQGQSYIALDYWKSARGFSFTIFDEDHRATMGHTYESSKATLVEVKTPGPAWIRLIRNGVVIWEERRRSYFERDVDLPGVYRVVADLLVRGQWRPWIFSNPIWVKRVGSS